jgi:leucyl-tRNA synthetase
VPTDAYVFVNCPAVGGDIDLSRLRGYLIADAHARFRRARGEDVLFTLGLDPFASSPKPAEGQSVDEWIAARRDELRAQLDRIGISLDWDRALLTSDPSYYRWVQWLFVKLFEAGLAYQRGERGWYLSTTTFNAENDGNLEQIEGWTDAARATQRTLLKRIDGFELEASALDGTALKLFTPHPDAIADAEFAAFSPGRPELDTWLADDAAAREEVEQMRNRDWSEVAAAELPVVELPMSVQVPSVAQPLPILVSPAIDARYGPAAVLGIPSVDAADKPLAKQLPKAGGLAWKVESKPPKTAKSVRYLTADMPLSRGRAWGPPVPVVHCEQCGPVTVPLDQLPLQPPDGLDVTARGNALAEHADFADCECPGCGGSARRDVGTLHPRFGTALIELALAVPPDDRDERLFDHPDLARWLPTAQTVEGIGAGGELLDMRTLAKAARDLGGLASLADGEPHGAALLHENLRIEQPSSNGSEATGAATASALVEAHGRDAVRFALLDAAAPAKAYTGGDQIVRNAARFLAELSEFAAPRLEGAPTADRIDLDDGLRRRLAGWCDTAATRMAENYERLDAHRATRNAIQLLRRIQDFEQRVVGYRGEVAGADREAVAVALGVLIALVSPLAPELVEALRRDGKVVGAEWPSAQREPAVA